MILYVNGDSHSVGAEAINPHAFANDDPQYKHLGKFPHPDNLKVSYGQLIANNLDYDLMCDAESGASNTRIIRTTYSHLEKTTPDLIVIGWTTWEREEWMFGDKYYQFSAGMNPVNLPKEISEIYKKWIVTRDRPHIYCEYWQERIWQLHQTLTSKHIPHVFFNTFSCLHTQDHKDWNGSYLAPYDQTQTYYDQSIAQGFKPKNVHHFGTDAHRYWAEYLTKIIKESIMVK